MNLIIKATALALLAIIIEYWSGFYRWFDANVADEKMKDATGKFLFGEDWINISLIKEKFDYSWLTEEAPILVAHAMGGSGSVTQNTLPEMIKSIEKGMRLMEVDLWLDDHGIIRCHHGPGLPNKYKEGDCTFEEALDLASKHHVYLILDIKTDFKKTGETVVGRLNSNNAPLVIFQLYKPEHAELYLRWHNNKPLAGPIITLYLAKRSVRHVQYMMSSSSFRVLTVPLNRLVAASFSNEEIVIFTHPVHACDEFVSVRRYGLSGFYVTNEISARLINNCR